MGKKISARKRPKATLIVPGTEAWKQATAQPLPPAGYAALQEEKAPKAELETTEGTKEKKSKGPKPRWKPDYKARGEDGELFYSFPRRPVAIVHVNVGFSDIAIIADDGSMWRLTGEKWIRIPDLPRRPMTEPHRVSAKDAQREASGRYFRDRAKQLRERRTKKNGVAEDASL